MNFSKPSVSLLVLAGLVSLGLMTGCSSPVVTVDSLTRPQQQANAVSYELRNENPDQAEDSLRYKEGADYIRTALSGKGLYEAPPGTKPELIVSVDFGIGPPQTRQEKKQEAIVREKPAGTRTIQVSMGVSDIGTPIYETVKIDTPPTTEITGFREVMVTVTSYEKHLRLTAREAGPTTEGRQPREIWSVEVISEGESRDLRQSLPILAASTIEFIGKDSQGQQQIRIKDISTDVEFVKKGLPEQKFVASAKPGAK